MSTSLVSDVEVAEAPPEEVEASPVSASTSLVSDVEVAEAPPPPEEAPEAPPAPVARRPWLILVLLIAGYVVLRRLRRR